MELSDKVASNIFIFTPNPGEMIQFDEHIFQMGWFNHQLGELETTPFFVVTTDYDIFFEVSSHDVGILF